MSFCAWSFCNTAIDRHERDHPKNEQQRRMASIHIIFVLYKNFAYYVSDFMRNGHIRPKNDVYLSIFRIFMVLGQSSRKKLGV